MSDMAHTVQGESGVNVESRPSAGHLALSAGAGTMHTIPGESGVSPAPAQPAGQPPVAAIGNRSAVNPGPTRESVSVTCPAPTPSLDRLLNHIRVCIGLGEGWPNNTVLCRVMRWRHLSSVKLALYRLERRGDIRRLGSLDRRMLWELTHQGIERRLG